MRSILSLVCASTSAALNLDGRLAYGALHDPGSLRRDADPSARCFSDYYRTQLGLLVRNHGVPLVTGISDRPIPLPFVVEEIGGRACPGAS